MILWCDGAHAPDENMRRDGALLAAAEAAPVASREGAIPEAVLRLFRFEPHGITLGRAQDPERTLDLARCRAEGVPWAVRPTGGRAIFHAEEWTWSLAAAVGDPLWGGGLSQAYARAARLVLRSLVRLGVPASLTPGGRGRAASATGLVGAAPTAPARRERAAVACFAATARHEIVLGGRKLVGSAQRRGARAMLQQGSVLLGPGHLRLADYLGLPEDKRAAVRRALESAATHAGPWLGGEAPLERWADSLMAELPAGVRRLDAASGAFLLTMPEAPSYTARS